MIPSKEGPHTTVFAAINEVCDSVLPYCLLLGSLTARPFEPPGHAGREEDQDESELEDGSHDAGVW